MKNVLLYGGGTQSTGLLLMMLDGMFFGRKPDMALFADTYSEPQFVMDYIFKVQEYVLEKYDFLIRTTSKDGYGLEYDLRRSNREGDRVASLPLFTENGGMIRRQCTQEYKITPMDRYIKKEYNIGRKKKGSAPLVTKIFGISLDEIERCRESTTWWAKHEYPLVEAGMKRYEVINYINSEHPELKNPPRSSCYFCPFHDHRYWGKLKEKHPNVFEDACKIDDLIRDDDKMKHKRYLHRSLKPLRDVDFTDNQFTIFGECEGYCGV